MRILTCERVMGEGLGCVEAILLLFDIMIYVVVALIAAPILLLILSLIFIGVVNILFRIDNGWAAIKQIFRDTN